MSTATERKAIDIESVGPIEKLTIPIPEGGGVVVLKGPNGSGKSHAISSVESLYSKGIRKSLRNSDGSPSGRISGLGVTVRLGRSNTAKGELVCESLDGRIDPSQLVDPGLKDPIAADARRLATLVRLSGVEVRLSDFEATLGDVAREINLPSLFDEDGIVFADRVRRKLHESALDLERRAEKSTNAAIAIEQTFADVDLSGADESVDLSAEYDAALEAVAAAKSQRQQQLRQVEQYNEAKLLLEDNSKKAVSVLDAKESLHAAESQLSSAELNCSELERQVSELQKKLVESQLLVSKCLVARDRAIEVLSIAERQQKQLQEWRQVVEKGAVEPISEAAIAELEAARSEARRRLEQREVVRRATEKKAEAESKREIALEQLKKSKRYRDLARSSDSVLEQALSVAGFTALRVHHGRLCVESDRGLEPFSDLSHGERWRLALDLAASGLPAGSVLPVAQEAFESLDPENQRYINQLARERGLVIVTAEACGGELRAEVMEVTSDE